MAAMNTPTLPALSRTEVHAADLDFQLAYRIRSGKTPSIVFIHGLGCSQDSFAHVFSLREFQDRSLLIFDLPGFGHSSRPESFCYSMPDLARVTLALLDALQLHDVHLVGHSMGGAVAVLLARDLGSRLVSLTSVEGNHLGSDCSLSREIARVSYDAFTKRMFPVLDTLMSESEKGYFILERASAQALYECSRSLVTWSDRGSLMQDFLAMDRQRFYVYGQKNSGLETVARLQDHVPMASIAGSSHFPMNQNPTAFYRALHSFLAPLDS
ncbi:MAG: alpha/beta hydrolase [Desulfovibrio sp.]|nr:MAG: alpha/beta hydrolase [Desulfovibrio sp.]